VSVVIEVNVGRALRSWLAVNIGIAGLICVPLIAARGIRDAGRAVSTWWEASPADSPSSYAMRIPSDAEIDQEFDRPVVARRKR